MSEHEPDYIAWIEPWLLGALSDEDSSAFETRLATDQGLQQAVRDAEDALATTWVAMSTPEAPSHDLLSRLMASTSPDHGDVLGFAGKLSSLLSITRAHAERLLGLLSDPNEWLPGPGPGTHLIHIDDVPLSKTAIVGFVKIEPGHTFPEHSHEGDEQTFVLAGTLRDGDRLIYRGQHDTLDHGSMHLIGAEGDEEVIYLTIADCGIKFGEFFIGPGDPEV